MTELPDYDRMPVGYGRSILGCSVGVIFGAPVALLLALAAPENWTNFASYTKSFSNLLPLLSLQSLFILPIIWFFALPVTLLVGMPIQLSLQKLKLTGYFVTILIAALAGAFVWPLLIMMLDGFSIEAYNRNNCAFGVVLAGTIATIAWLIRRPDLDSKPSVSR